MDTVAEKDIYCKLQLKHHEFINVIPLENTQTPPLFQRLSRRFFQRITSISRHGISLAVSSPGAPLATSACPKNSATSCALVNPFSLPPGGLHSLQLLPLSTRQRNQLFSKTITRSPTEISTTVILTFTGKSSKTLNNTKESFWRFLTMRN